VAFLIWFAGAVGVGFSGKIKSLYPEAQVTLIHSGEKLLSQEALPGKFKCRALRLLQEQGVTVLLSERPKVTAMPDKTFLIELQSGSCMSAGFVISATSGKDLSTGFLPSSVLNVDGSIKIDAQ
jgi:NADH dehydrogenase FAD-containing subunit